VDKRLVVQIRRQRMPYLSASDANFSLTGAVASARLPLRLHLGVWTTAMCRYAIRRYSLKIEQVHKNDSGRYACQAKNDVGQAWLNFTITVTGITRQSSAIAEKARVFLANSDT